jgi:hypothetical protein
MNCHPSLRKGTIACAHREERVKTKTHPKLSDGSACCPERRSPLFEFAPAMGLQWPTEIAELPLLSRRQMAEDPFGESAEKRSRSCRAGRPEAPQRPRVPRVAYRREATVGPVVRV